MDVWPWLCLQLPSPNDPIMAQNPGPRLVKFAVIFSIGFVFVAEILNTAIENIADFISPGKNDKIKKIKDLAAAGVLISALTAFSIALIIFIPKIQVWQ